MWGTPLLRFVSSPLYYLLHFLMMLQESKKTVHPQLMVRITLRLTGASSIPLESWAFVPAPCLRKASPYTIACRFEIHVRQVTTVSLRWKGPTAVYISSLKSG